MKLFHVHMNVVHFDGSIRFYSQLFGVDPGGAPRRATVRTRGATPARPPAARADRVTAMKRVLFVCVENANHTRWRRPSRASMEAVPSRHAAPAR